MKLIRILLSIVALAVVVSVIAISCLVIFVDPNNLKPVIVKEVMKDTGYQLTIEGKLSWSFYPKLGVKIEHMTVTAPGQSSPFVDLHKTSVATDLFGLIRGNEKLNGDIYISYVKLMNMQARSAHVGLHWQNKILTMQPISASLYDGSMKGIAYGRDLDSIPRWEWDVEMSRVQIKPLLQDMDGHDSKLSVSGLGQVNMQALSWGKTKSEITNNLNGTVQFNVQNGLVDGIDLNYLLKSADALMNRQPVEAPSNLNQTAFESLAGTINIKNGVANTNNLLLSSTAFTSKANGSINLPYQAINLQLQVAPQKEARTQWVIPVLIAGNLSHPDVRLDMIEIDKLIASKEIDKVKSTVRDQIKEKVPGKAGEFLQNLLGS